MNNFLQNQYSREFNDQIVQYFIFDTIGEGHGDVDFIQYGYTKERYNLPKEGDLFIYRRPQKYSHNNQFFFFGCGQISNIEYDEKVEGNTRVRAKITKPILFDNNVYQSDILDYNWIWKEKRNHSYEQFFSNYGMNKIPKEDFINLCSLGIDDSFEKAETNKLEVELNEQYDKGNFMIDDKTGITKIRGAAQKVFSNKLKEIYNNECCISGITTVSMLRGSHIIPWSKNKETRLNPTNGLLLSVFWDQLFDKGFITVDSDFKILINEAAKNDEVLYSLITDYEGKKIKLPSSKHFRPNQEFLKYHKSETFDKLNRS
ncbi:HNH endonuclease [Segetibacter koreensis]|uniref:HNH endonuclease n=1 Tax=Segetibacter koreensis TaxID=398037 RepID=UPI00036CC340|nr:HNH endonuclease [Segetibacter koreensis]